MPVSNIAFANLKAEMARESVSINEIALYLGYNRATVGKKLARESPLSLADAGAIREKFFPNKTLPYLFKEALPEPPNGKAG